MGPGDRRVVVALDPATSGSAAARAAVELAVALGAPLSGVFVEDVELLRAALLPFSRLVHDTGHSRGIDSVSVETALRAAVARARNDLEAAAGSARLEVSFRVARGAVFATLREEARQRDLIVIGSVSRGSSPESVRARPLAVVVGEPAESAAVLEVVDALVQSGGGPIRSFRRDLLPDAPSFARRLVGERVRALVLGLDDPWVSDATLRVLRRRVACPIVLVR